MEGATTKSPDDQHRPFLGGGEPPMWYVLSMLGLVCFGLAFPFLTTPRDMAPVSLLFWAWVGITMARWWAGGFIMLVGQWLSYIVTLSLSFVSENEFTLWYLVVVPGGIAMLLEYKWILSIVKSR